MQNIKIDELSFVDRQTRPTESHWSTSTLGKGEAPKTLAQRACTVYYNFISINQSSQQKTIG